ncbi:glycine-rich domain-containing protein [Streptomyces niveus]|uniref:glycine-rich domain-containing protein n=1 Tax=Streptomyces niveus TaxID=193462 RepID=UPI0036D3B32C
MSMTVEAPVTRDARDLLTADELASVTATVQANNPGMGRETAEEVVVQALKFEATCSTYARGPLAPSRIVDEGWHALILHTRIKARLADRIGHFVHHVPEAPDPTRRAPNVLLRTQAAMEDAGYIPDPKLWVRPSDTSIPVAASCQHRPGGEEGTCTGDPDGDGPSGPN